MKRFYSALAGLAFLSCMLAVLLAPSCAYADEVSRAFNACRTIQNADDRDDCNERAWDKFEQRFIEQHLKPQPKPQPKPAPHARALTV